MRILVTGASGRLGGTLVERLVAAGHEVIGWSGATRGRCGGVELRPVDLTDERAVTLALTEADPEAILHAAAVTSAEAAYRQPQWAAAVNIGATRHLAAWAARNDRRFLYTSTDLVFDGAKSWYREHDPAEPILEYGRTKRAAEPFVMAIPRGVVARLSLLFGPSRHGTPSFFDRAFDALGRGELRSFFEDEYRTPVDYRTAAAILVRLVESGATGIVHVGGQERLSRFELMRRAAIVRGLDPDLVRANRLADHPAPEPRPADVSLDTTRLATLLPGLERPGIENALDGTDPLGGSAATSRSPA
jgi:dTDP-4-dehydrorhamnose reductase